MKQTRPTARPGKGATLQVTVDPLAVARGHRVMPRGGVHATDRKASRARAKALWRRQQSRQEGVAVAVLVGHCPANVRG